MAFNPLRGAAQGLASRALKKVAGNIRGGLLGITGRGSNLSDTAGLSNTKYNKRLQNNIKYKKHLMLQKVEVFLLVQMILKKGRKTKHK
mgnify:CR=1 FL=1